MVNFPADPVINIVGQIAFLDKVVAGPRNFLRSAAIYLSGGNELHPIAFGPPTLAYSPGSFSPSINASGVISFVSSIVTPQDTQRGLFIYTQSGLSSRLATGQPSPEFGTVFFDFDDVMINDNNDLVFTALIGHVSDSRDRLQKGIFLISGNTIVTIALQRGLATAASSPFGSFSRPHLTGNAVIFVAGGPSELPEKGIYRVVFRPQL